MFEHIMLDLETLSSGPRAAILSIGAVRFDLSLGIGPQIEIFIHPTSYHGVMEIDADTVGWWMSQRDEAKELFRKCISEGSLPICTALDEFSQFVGNDNDSLIWGNGSTFDNIILRNSYQVCGKKYFVSYKNDLCYRTLRRMFPHSKIEEGVKHGALQDALNQAKTMIGLMKGLPHV